ncbi:MAG: hypothetical protein GX754_01110 [Clostridiaceae bacterium]|nr:hypothetical protein [Clostridiaceae bacterium]
MKHGYDIRDTEAAAMFSDKKKEVCPKVIETMVLILEEMGFFRQTIFLTTHS